MFESSLHDLLLGDGGGGVLDDRADLHVGLALDLGDRLGGRVTLGLRELLPPVEMTTRR